MGFIQGEGRTQGTLFPVVLDDLVPGDHVCRVIDAFRCAAGDERTRVRAFRSRRKQGRPGYDPRDLLKLYLYGYLQQIRSSRRLEARVQAQRGSDVVAGPSGSRLQEHRRIPAFASRSA